MLVLDGGASMEADFFEQAKCMIRRLLGKMFVSGGQHEVALLAFGMEETDNALYEGKFMHRVEVENNALTPQAAGQREEKTTKAFSSCRSFRNRV